MPATFQLNCPNCGTAHVGFELVNESWLPRHSQWHACIRCNHCLGLAVIEFKSWGNEELSPSKYYVKSPECFTIEKMHPASGSEFPAHLPDEVAKFFKQGADNTPANPDAAGIMFRKALEAMLRDKCPDAKGRLQERIDQAAETDVLSGDLARYAHTIRLKATKPPTAPIAKPTLSNFARS